MMKFNRYIMLMLLAALLMIAGCTDEQDSGNDTGDDGGVGLANPASEFCIENGGVHEIRTDDSGNQYGICVIGGHICDEWAYYRGECLPSDVGTVNDFNSCVAAGGDVMESHPRQCTYEGRTYAEIVSDIDPVACPAIYAPVCGVNGETYSNDCVAGAARVDVAYEGECGIDNAFAVERVCTMEYNPVCGMDGVTYSNPCLAGEMMIAHYGDCDAAGDDLICTMEYNPVCGIDGMTYSNPCFAGQMPVAYYGECGEENALAVDRICTREYNPVCGMDGVTYSNPCMAGDMSIAYEGECISAAQDTCLVEGGDWLPEHNECEGMSRASCNELGGEFDECASACRHFPDAEMCTMQCVLVCKF